MYKATLLVKEAVEKITDRGISDKPECKHILAVKNLIVI